MCAWFTLWILLKDMDTKVIEELFLLRWITFILYSSIYFIDYFSLYLKVEWV